MILDGKVAIVTGAGSGLGRVEALELARHGARVVVNDLEVTLEGGSGAGSTAEQVAEEIRADGGEAIVNHADVSDWEAARALVQSAVDTFGDLHVLVNNAGILRDRMIFNITEEEWDSVIRVHLKGHAGMSRWATGYWRDRSKELGEPVYARIINTSSESMFGNPGQPNYGAAKGGIVALTIATARACRGYGVNANAICPRARTRMTEQFDFFDTTGEAFDVFAPENISPLVAYLASPDAAQVSGEVFLVWGSMVAVLGAPGIDRRVDTDGRWTVADLARELDPFFDKRRPIDDGMGSALALA